MSEAELDVWYNQLFEDLEPGQVIDLRPRPRSTHQQIMGVYDEEVRRGTNCKVVR